MSLIHGVLADSDGVPQFDGLVTRRRNNLTVVSGESNTENILLVSNESLGGDTSGNVPQSESSVPRGRQSKMTIGRNDDILDKVRVSSKGSLGMSVRISGSGKSPDDDGLVTGGRQDHKIGRAHV